MRVQWLMTLIHPTRLLHLHPCDRLQPAPPLYTSFPLAVEMGITLGLSGACSIVLNEEIHLKCIAQNLVYNKGPIKVNSCYSMAISVGTEITEGIQEIFRRKNE